MTKCADLIQRLEDNVSRALVGKSGSVRLAVVGLLARGHLLIEDVPGVGKTTLAAALARSIGAGFQRIQFTSDMLPSDVLGVSVWEPKTSEFVFKPGPLFTNIILADEINRTTPKTQSSLLEAMNEAQVSLDHSTYPLPRPFMVLATQNPREYEGTFPLPESQLDRFLLRVRIGYPDAGRREGRARAEPWRRRPARLGPVLTGGGGARAAGSGRAGARGGIGARLPRRPRGRDAPLAAPVARREPARLARAAAGGAREGARRWPRLPRARRHQGAGRRGPRASGHGARPAWAPRARAVVDGEAAIRAILQDVPVPR